MLPTIFQSTEHFRRAFARGLERLAQRQEPGPTILVAANNCQDPTALSPACQRIRQDLFAATCQKYQAALTTPQVNERENITILRNIKEQLNTAALATTSTRKIDNTWPVQLNPIRKLRPRRDAAKTVMSMREHEPFDQLKLNFTMEQLQTECIWKGTLEGRRIRLFFNMFPFRTLHAILVPEPTKQYRQELTEELHLWACVVVELVGSKIPWFGMGYNSVGAFASIDHLHWQTYIDPVLLPVMHDHWQHNDGKDAYPLPCETFTRPNDSWEWIKARQEADRPYNLLYTPSRVFCFPRPFQGSYGHAPWTSGFAWYECAGGMITFTDAEYDVLTATMILDEYAKMRDA
jgi:hypothetical protein